MKSYNINTLGSKGRLWRLGTLIGLFSLALLITVGLLTACPEDSNGTNGTNGTAPLPPEFPLQITDQAGRLVMIEAMPVKIVSLTSSNTEILFALGLDDEVAGVTTYCDYPEAAKDKPKVGGYTSVDLEKVLEIQPDLIVAGRAHIEEVVPLLEELGLTVVVMDPKTVDGILEAIELVGKCTGKLDEAYQLIIEMENRIKAVTDKTRNLAVAQKPMVFWVHWHDPLMTPGSNSLYDELISLAGGINTGHDMCEGFGFVSLEAVIFANPEVIIAGTGMGAGADLALQFAQNEPRLADCDARLNNRVYGIDLNSCRLGPRIVDGLEQLAKMIHPEIFGT